MKKEVKDTIIVELGGQASSVRSASRMRLSC